MIKEIICIVCPKSCLIRVDYTGKEIREIKGSLCKKGNSYVQEEIFSPMRTLTSSLRVRNGELPLVSVKINRAIPRKKFFQVMEVLYRREVSAPIKIGDVLIENVASTGANIVATKKISKGKRGKIN